MLTIFAAPRGFDGRFERIQINALRSWASLKPRPEILVFGAEPGTEEVCRNLELRWVPHLVATERGLPLLPDLFGSAERLATGRLLAYVNIDIILMQDFVEAIEAAQRHFDRFVLVGSPWNTEVPYDLEDDPEAWSARLTNAVLSSGQAPPARGADVFVFPRGVYDDTPNLAIGRWWFDNWMIHRACFGPVPAVDITNAALLVHQDHGGTSHAEPALVSPPSVQDPDTRLNHDNTSVWSREVIRADVPYLLQRNGSLEKRYAGGRPMIISRILLRQRGKVKDWVLEKTGRPRQKLGLYRWWKPRKDITPDQSE